MFDKSNATRSKREVVCDVTLTNQDPFLGAVFLKHDERLIDLLNDPRAFIPMRNADGAPMIVAKSSIVSIIESDPAMGGTDEDDTAGPEEDPETEAPRRTIDPYAVLRVDRDADLEAVKAAYKARIKAVHPDAIAGLQLDEDFAKTALRVTQRVNLAYRMIMRQRASDTETAA
ncbi:MAG: DnaJ domain-containing protein [Pseudomonadota bacterium]